MCFVLLWSFIFCEQKTAYEMRISDWSSDVCSSDLLAGLVLGEVGQCLRDRFSIALRQCSNNFRTIGAPPRRVDGHHDVEEAVLLEACFRIGVDRKSVVEGKRGSVRVDHGGRRIIQKKNKTI